MSNEAAQLESPQFKPTPIERTHNIDNRRVKRQRVIKLAQLIFGVSGVIVDCLVIDESRLGVQLETHVVTDIPENVKVRYNAGPTYDAIRRWASGNKIGLEFISLFPGDEATKRQIRIVKNVLKDVGLRAAVQIMREADFFECSELRSAAEAAEIAMARLESALD